MKNAILPALVVLGFAGAADAASVFLQTSASANTNATAQDAETTTVNGESTVDAPVYSTTASAASGGVSNSSFALADGDQGILRASSTMSGNLGDGNGDGGTTARATVVENYTLTGTGTLTVSLLLDGSWDLSRVDSQGNELTPFWQAQSSILLAGTNGDRVCLGTACGQSIDTSNSGSIENYLLSVSRDYTANIAPINTDVTFTLLTSLGTANGFLDFGSTAKFIVETTGSLIATPSDPDFISDPAFNDSTVIPLPAGLPLLLAGLGALGVMALRNRPNQ